MIGEADQIVGRTRELRMLDASLGDALSGRSRVVFLSGDPGIGKTSLAGALARSAESCGAAVAWGRSWEAGGAPPFWPWAQALRSYARQIGMEEAALLDQHPAVAQLGVGAAQVVQPATPDNASDPEARFLMFEEVAAFLAATTRQTPLVLILDDLHAADLPSLLLLQFVARSLRDAPLLLIGTHRHLAAHATPEAAALLLDAAREASSILIGGLSRDESSALIARSMGRPASDEVVSRVHELTEGNPFFVDEVSQLLAASGHADADGPVPIPDSVRDAVRRRVALLPAQTRSLLAVASVGGRNFNLDVISAVTDEPRSALIERLEPARTARIVLPSAESFSHAIVRETIYAAIPPVERARWHRRFVGALDTPGGEQISEVAYHASAAVQLGDTGPAAIYAERAGRSALAALAFEDAVRSFRQALDGLAYEPESADARRCPLLLCLGDALWRAGELTESRQIFDRAAAVAKASGDGTMFATAVLRAGEIHAGGVWSRAWKPDEPLVALSEQALKMVTDPSLRARLLARLGTDLHFSSRRDDGIALVTEAVDLAERIGDEYVIAYCLTARHNAIWAPDTVEERLGMAEEMVRLSLHLGNRELLMTSHAWRQTDLLELGRVGLAERDADTYIRLADESRRPQYDAYAKLMRSARARMRGDLEHAGTLARAVYDFGAASGDDNIRKSAVTQLVVTEMLRDADRAFEHCYELFEDMDVTNALQAAVLSYLPDRERARSYLDAVFDAGLPVFARDAFWTSSMSGASTAVIEIDDVEFAAGLLTELAPFARYDFVFGRNAVVREGPVAIKLAGLAVVAGEFDRAAEYLSDGLRRARSSKSPVWVAYALLESGRLHARRGAAGDRAAAIEMLDECIEVSKAHDLQSIVAKAEQMRPAFVAAPDRALAKDGPSLVREGEYWTVTYEGSVARLRSARGLEHLATLIAHPKSEMHALDLASPGRSLATDGLKAQAPGEMLDEQAKRSYRERLQDARAEIDEASAFHDEGRVVRLQAEIDAIIQELSAAAGLGGRDRPVDSVAERARIAVTKSIRSAIDKIAGAIPELGEHLAAAVRTGTFCVYDPS